MGGLVLALIMGGGEGDIGGLGDPFLSGYSLLDWVGSWIWYLGRDSPVLGHSSCEGYRGG